MRVMSVRVDKGHPDARRADHWSASALCGSAPERDKQTFTGARPTRTVALDLVRRYCDRCPVKAQCLKWAESDLPFTGIAGGKAFIGEKVAGRPRRVITITIGSE